MMIENGLDSSFTEEWSPHEDWDLPTWLYYLEHRHKQEIHLRLVNAAQVAKTLSLLEWTIPVITVAGTNGKGSTVAALSAVYQAAGYRVGEFTSPHLFRFNERISINQQPIADADLCQLFHRIELARGEIRLTFFEMSLIAALLHFKESNLDLMILEVGLGGRLDATNIIDADLAIITTIDLDHQEYLGSDKEAIGKEKAGVLRRNQLFIYADLNAPQSVIAHGHMLETAMYRLGVDYHYQIITNEVHIQHPFSTEALTLPVPALHSNAAVAAVIASLCLQTRLPVASNDWIKAMQSMHIWGRKQWVNGAITFVYDVAHNPQAADSLAQCIMTQLYPDESRSTFAGKIHAVFSALKDKDIYGLIKPLSTIVDQWYPACLSGSRASSREQLLEAFSQLKMQPHCYLNPQQATQAALAAAKAGDVIVVYGSFWLVGAIMPATEQS